MLSMLRIPLLTVVALLVATCLLVSVSAAPAAVATKEKAPTATGSRVGKVDAKAAPSSKSKSKSNEAAASSSSSSSSSSSFVDVQKTLSLAKSLSAHSWEYGAMIQASLEVNNPELSVFSRSAFPNGTVPRLGNPSSIDALAYAQKHILLTGKSLADGQGAVGDPASLGVAAVLLARGNSSSQTSKYASAAQRQVNTILQAPRLYNGALSQRADVAEAWADNMFMTPPFLAYYAVASQDKSLLKLAVQQCTLQRQVLLANTTAKWHGLWTHIVGPQSQTLGIWATGNGWAALGMVRVLATVQHWNVSASWKTERAMLTGYLMDIFNALDAVKPDAQTGLLRNYLVGGANSQRDTSVKWFGDAAGTAALVAAALRLAVLDDSLAPRLVALTRPFRTALARRVNTSSGLVTPTVDPYDWHTTKAYTRGSPEAQAFIAMAGAAWRDCMQAGVCTQGD